tara:strand:+ start:69 stop:485 length:417 start_codon:yes stop_codon:yes gene_type:complete
MASSRKAKSANRFYDDHAQRLFEQYQSLSFDRIHSDWLHHLSSQPGLALDVGAGSGRDAEALAKRGWQVIAVEPSDRLRALGQAHTIGDDISWLNDTLPSMNLVRHLSQRFQLILVSAVWMHLDYDEQKRAFAYSALS